MELFAKDVILGDFRASDHGAAVGSFSYQGDAEYELGMDIEVIEAFIGHNPVPVYLGQKYTSKLKPQITLVKNPCVYKDRLYFDDYECRAILRKVTGIYGYQWMKLIDDEPSEDIWYKAKVTSVSYKRSGGHVAGIILNMECDSSYAWSGEQTITVNAAANEPFYIFNNTDDCSSYVLPAVIIIPSSGGTWTAVNQTEGWTSEIKNIRKNESITMHCSTGTLTSSAAHGGLLDDFNLHWIRLLPGKNEYVCNMDTLMTFRFRAPRKAGFV